MRQVLQLLYDFCFEQAAKAAKEAGFTYVAMGFGSSGCFHGEDWEKHLTAIDKTLTQNGLICVQTHLPYYPLTVSAEETDPVMDRAMLRCMEAGKKLGASRHVYHPRTAVNDNYSPRASLRYAKEAVKPLAEAAEKTGTVLCLENLPIFPDIHTMRFFTSDYEDLAELCDCFSPEAVRVCWDFGHANLMNNNQEKAIATMGNRIAATHIHGNDGKSDSHFLPSQGNIDWQKVIPALKKTGYTGDLTLEINYDTCLPYLTSFFAHARDILSFFAAL